MQALQVGNELLLVVQSQRQSRCCIFAMCQQNLRGWYDCSPGSHWQQAGSASLLRGINESDYWPRREQLSFLLWDPAVLPWVLPLGKWKGFSGPEVQRSSGMNLQHICKLEMCSSTDTGQLPLR